MASKRHRIVSEKYSIDQPITETIPQLFDRRCKELGSRTVLRYKKFGLWHDVSWQSYGQIVRKVAMGFVSLGLKPADIVAIIGDNRPEWIFSDLGCMVAGGVSVGIYTTNSSEECAYIIKHSEAKIYIVENEEQLDKALEIREDCSSIKKIVVMDTEGLRHFEDPMVISFDELIKLGEEFDKNNPDVYEARLACRKPDDLALLIYTSGTTGPPKGAMLSHENVLWTGRSMASAEPFYDDDESISFLPLSHIAERNFTTFMPLTFKNTINFIENVDTVTDNVVEVSPTAFFAVPRIWEKYASSIYIKMKDSSWFKRMVFGFAMKIGKKRAEARLSPEGVPPMLKLAYSIVHFAVFRKLKERLGFERIRVAISGAAPISADVLKFYHAIGIPLRQIYGQTEDTGPTSMHQGDIIEADSVGPAIPGVQIKIAEDGEILVKGRNVFMGYYKNPEATAETIQDGWLYSGDVGVIDDRGFLKITDRKKDLIITAGGKNIAPQNIENQLKASPYINDAVAIGDRRKFMSALIFIDEDNVVKYATDHKIPFTTYESLTQRKEIVKLIQEELDEVNKTLARVEQIKKFTLIPKKLMEEDGEVTPTMKLKRKAINKAYSELIEGMYKS